MKFTLALLILASTAILVASMRSSGASKKRAAKKRAEKQCPAKELAGSSRPAEELRQLPDGRVMFVRPPNPAEELTGRQFGAILAKLECAKWECAELERNAKQRGEIVTQGERKEIFDKWECTKDDCKAIFDEWQKIDLEKAGQKHLTEVDYQNLLCILFHDNQDQFKRILAEANICNENADPKTIREIILKMKLLCTQPIIWRTIRKGLTIKSID